MPDHSRTNYWDRISAQLFPQDGRTRAESTVFQVLIFAHSRDRRGFVVCGNITRTPYFYMCEPREFSPSFEYVQPMTAPSLRQTV